MYILVYHFKLEVTSIKKEVPYLYLKNKTKEHPSLLKIFGVGVPCCCLSLLLGRLVQ